MNVSASLGEHEEPEIHVGRGLGEGGHGVVDQHAAVGQPEQCEDGHHHNQHLDNLDKVEIDENEFREEI